MENNNVTFMTLNISMLSGRCLIKNLAMFGFTVLRVIVTTMFYCDLIGAITDIKHLVNWSVERC